MYTNLYARNISLICLVSNPPYGRFVIANVQPSRQTLSISAPSNALKLSTTCRMNYELELQLRYHPPELNLTPDLYIYSATLIDTTDDIHLQSQDETSS